MKLTVTDADKKFGPNAKELTVEDRLDAPNAPEVRAHLDQLLGEGHHNIVVNLAGVSFVDSAGLAALVRGMKGARQVGGDLRLVRPSTQEAFRVFELTKFDEVFEFVESDAVASAGQ